MKMTTTILIADDHELVRTGLRRLLQDIDCAVVGEAASGEEAVEAARAQSPDIALIDIHMPGIGGLEATQKLHRISPGTRVVILTAHPDGPLPRALLEIGVAGFLTKGCSVEEMHDAIRKVMAGGRYVSQEVAQNIALDAVDGSTTSPFERLTARELQVALMLLAGEVNRDISRTLQVSPKTVTTYRQRIFRKVGVRTIQDLLRQAIRFGLTSAEHTPPVTGCR
jgi:two-component system invasion response regulator UvrY